ncbi:MAG: MFS transporter [Burkholderiaceae bacterium]
MSGTAALAPFRIRSFRFQWPADLLTAWALDMETLILGWYILIETRSVAWLSVFGALQFIGTLLSPVLGMLGDRLGLSRVLTLMRLSYACFAGLICVLAFSGHLTPMAVMIIALLVGLIRPTDIGMRSALVGASMPPSLLTSAMGVSRTTMDSAKVGGALLGTGFMAAFGMGPVYLLITCMYIGGALLTLSTRISGSGASAARGHAAESGASLSPAASDASRLPAPSTPWRDLKEGMVYIWRTPRLRAAMMLAALVNLTAFPLTGGLMPYVAKEVFHLDQQGLGWLVASFSVGAFIGSVSISTLGSRLPPGRTMLATTLLWYLCLVGFVLSTQLAWALFMLVLAGLCQSLSMLTLSVLLLRTSEERFRGRIMGVRMLAIYPLPLGLLILGALIPPLGYIPSGVVMVMTGLVLLAALAYTWREHLITRHAPGNAV